MGTERANDDTVGMATRTVEHGHERRDVRVAAVLATAAGLLGIAAVLQVALYFHMMGLWRLRQRELPPPPPVATALPDAPPEPRLQTAPALDLRALRDAEDAQLHGYGWVDRAAGITHIPIDRAIALLAAEAERESARAGRRGPGASEQRSAQSARAAHGPPDASNAERESARAGRRGKP